MFRYKLRTLLILIMIAPPALAGAWLVWRQYAHHQEGFPPDVERAMAIDAATIR